MTLILISKFSFLSCHRSLLDAREHESERTGKSFGWPQKISEAAKEDTEDKRRKEPVTLLSACLQRTHTSDKGMASGCQPGDICC